MNETNDSPLKFGAVPNLNNIIGAIKNITTLNQATGMAPGTEIAPGTENANTSGMSAITSGMSAMANPQVATTDASSGNMFEGQKFQITPVQMKGSFSPNCQNTANKIYGSEEERAASVSPINKKSYGY
jgi:hypothetical protein